MSLHSTMLARLPLKVRSFTVNTAGNLDNTKELTGADADLNVDGTLSNSGKLDIANALTIKGHNNSHSTALNNNAGGAIVSGSGGYSVATSTMRLN